MQELLVKENASWRAPLSWRWVCAALAASALALAGVARIDHALPDPLTRASAPPGRFVAEIAYEHLLNLTSIGPRVRTTLLLLTDKPTNRQTRPVQFIF